MSIATSTVGRHWTGRSNGTVDRETTRPDVVAMDNNELQRALVLTSGFFSPVLKLCVPNPNYRLPACLHQTMNVGSLGIGTGNSKTKLKFHQTA